jgi:hypothetical protein
MKDGILIEIDGCNNCSFHRKFYAAYPEELTSHCLLQKEINIELPNSYILTDNEKHPTNCPLLKNEVTVRLMEDNNNTQKELEETVEQKLAKHLYGKQVSNTYQVGEAVRFIKDNYNLIPKK